MAHRKLSNVYSSPAYPATRLVISSDDRRRDEAGWPMPHDDEIRLAYAWFNGGKPLGFRIGWQLARIAYGIYDFARRFR